MSNAERGLNLEGIQGGPRIVVTGLGAVTPVGNDIETAWGNIKAGNHGFSIVDLYPSTISVAGQVKDFDPGAIFTERISVAGSKYPFRKFINRLSPAALFQLAASNEALRNAGVINVDYELNPGIDPDEFAVIGASGIGGAEEVVEIYKRLSEDEKTALPSSLLKLLIERGATFASIIYDAKAGAANVSTACASGGRAINDGIRHLLLRDAEMVLLNAGEYAVHPVAASLFDNTGTTSKATSVNEAGLPLDKNRNGFVLAEGGGAMVIETLDHALRRGAEPLVEIVGYASTSDAWHDSQPTGDGVRKAVLKAKKKSGLDFRGRNKLVKLHATGTQLDPVEVNAFKDSNGEGGTLFVFDPKNLEGHLLGATGLVEANYAALALREGVLPPTINVTKPIDELEGTVFETEKAREMEDVSIAITNSSGFGGDNEVTIFQSYDGPRVMREI